MFVHRRTWWGENMGLGVWFSEDLAHVLHGVGEGVRLLVAQRGLHDAADVAYVAGYWAALRAVATSLGLADCRFRMADFGWQPPIPNPQTTIRNQEGDS